MTDTEHRNQKKVLFEGTDQVPVKAVFLAESIDVKALGTGHWLGRFPHVVPAGADGCAVVFRYGAVVTFNLSPEEEADFLRSVKTRARQPFSDQETESAVLRFPKTDEERVPDDVIQLSEASIPRIQIVASILAKSVALAHFEESIAEASNHVEPFAAALRQGVGAGPPARELLRHLGDALLGQHRMIGRIEPGEKPDLLWDHPELERLYLRLEDEYELEERNRALGRKLDLISRTAETVLGLLNHRRTLRVEWYIVILIVVEIILMLYTMVM